MWGLGLKQVLEKANMFKISEGLDDRARRREVEGRCGPGRKDWQTRGRTAPQKNVIIKRGHKDSTQQYTPLKTAGDHSTRYVLRCDDCAHTRPGINTEIMQSIHWKQRLEWKLLTCFSACYSKHHTLLHFSHRWTIATALRCKFGFHRLARARYLSTALKVDSTFWDKAIKKI